VVQDLDLIFALLSIVIAGPPAAGSRFP
jgi:hypothetical protein